MLELCCRSANSVLKLGAHMCSINDYYLRFIEKLQKKVKLSHIKPVIFCSDLTFFFIISGSCPAKALTTGSL